MRSSWELLASRIKASSSLVALIKVLIDSSVRIVNDNRKISDYIGPVIIGDDVKYLNLLRETPDGMTDTDADRALRWRRKARKVREHINNMHVKALDRQAKNIYYLIVSDCVALNYCGRIERVWRLNNTGGWSDGGG